MGEEGKEGAGVGGVGGRGGRVGGGGRFIQSKGGVNFSKHWQTRHLGWTPTRGATARVRRRCGRERERERARAREFIENGILERRMQIMGEETRCL
jgi:hypothetical protein